MPKLTAIYLIEILFDFWSKINHFSSECVHRKYKDCFIPNIYFT